MVKNSRDKKNSDSTVKIDSKLLDNVEEFIEKDENRLKFVNKKQFIDLAVNDFLDKIKTKSKGGDK